MSAEQALRRRFGIPEDAEKVLIFAESSHWDPNWLYTAEEYFERFVRKNLNLAMEALRKEPRRVYSVECVFFLRLYWERRPEQRETIRRLVNEGRLRLTGSGVTTADTLLPSAEAILRDWLIGQEWLRAHGMTQEPTLFYFTDSFGATPTLPSLLKAAGFDRAALTRIDGMYFPGCDLEPKSRFPRPGSSAERLLKQERSLDFIWRDRNGAEVLCHWNAFTYGQGDMLAYIGISRVYLARLAIPWRSDRHIARRIHQYVRQLAPLSRTPYLFCPIGFDFVEPIPDLVALLDRYNEKVYPHTGIWVLNAGLDDYLALVETHREHLPVLELDPNPYWTGFYTARPTLKRRCRRLVDDLLLAEKLSFLPENEAARQTLNRDLKKAWWTAAVSNHHDFITGTSPDRVVEEEQIPWLEAAQAQTEAVLARLTPAQPPAADAPASSSASLTWSREGSRLQVHTSRYRLELDEATGGTILCWEVDGGVVALAPGSNDLVSYRDSGGLWRMGYEFVGGTWREAARASQRPARWQVHPHPNGLEIVSRLELEGEVFVRKIWLEEGSPLLRFRVEGKAPPGCTVIVRLATGLSPVELLMDTPGGLVLRPLRRVYDPTFWPLHRFVHLRDRTTGRGLAIFQPLPGAVSCRPDGRVELVAMRNATRERAFGFLPLPANPASGHERETYAYEYALLFTPDGDWRDNELVRWTQEAARSPWDDPTATHRRGLAEAVAITDSPDVWVAAVKPAARGEGIIVRLNALEAPEAPVSLSFSHDMPIMRAFLCDARERDLEPLEVQDGVVRVPMTGTVATIRLEMDEGALGTNPR